jgi:hypothetical protein
MKLTLRPAILSDAPNLTDIYFSAFSSDAISLLCFLRNNAAVHTFWYDSIRVEMKDTKNHFLCVVDEDVQLYSTTPFVSMPPVHHIIAYAKWVSPAAPSRQTSRSGPKKEIRRSQITFLGAW